MWTAEQLKTFLCLARRHRLFAFFHLAAFTGARRGELLNLRWTSSTSTLTRSPSRARPAFIDGKRIEGTTKTGRTRVVSIDQGTVHVLKEHRRQQAADKLLAGEEWRGLDDHVFTTRWGDPIHPDTVSSLMPLPIKSYNNPKAAEPLPHARLHDLRHIHATTLLLAGVPVHVVAARLGHVDPSVTLRVDAHVIRAAEASAAEIFAKAIGT